MLNKYLAKFVLVSFSVTLVLALRLASWSSMTSCPDALAGGAYPYTVNTVVDENDDSCSDGDCSLRDAIILANNTPGLHLINFDIQSGCGGFFTCTIYPDTPLPTLSGGGTTIDGSDSHKWIQIDGTNAGSSVGFEITSAYNVIKGLTIKKFQGHGIFISGGSATDNVISDNYIGTDASSTANQGNGLSGVYIDDGARNNTVEDNVISGNGEDGIVIVGSDTMNNTVSGNYIGTKANGTEALGNTYVGVGIDGDAQNNTIGPNNVIAHNGDTGVLVSGGSTTSNTITQNSIYSNTGGIGLFWGANGDIAAPVIFTTTTGSVVNIIGTACPNCTVEVFQNSDDDGEGEDYRGKATADASGNFTITVASLNRPYLTATATDDRGTSMFSVPFLVTMPSAPDAGKVYLPIIIRN